MKKLLLSFALLVPSYLIADGCTNPQNSYDRTYCQAKLFLQSDDELNAEYLALQKLLNENSDKKPKSSKVNEFKKAKDKLKSTQLSWIKYRNRKCESSGTIDVDCNLQVNISRTNFLRDRLRECRAGHCQTDKIGQQSW